MTLDLTGANGDLLERYIESVLLRYSDGKYSLAEATQDLIQSHRRAASGDPGLLADLRGVIEAGDDA
ncbi:MAG: hypothetical protein JWM33_3084 [Caulobacteraceae bacterium]|nr:hypothetical protein [Caulobacteraceae bacterium]